MTPKNHLILLDRLFLYKNYIEYQFLQILEFLDHTYVRFKNFDIKLLFNYFNIIISEFHFVLVILI